MSNITSDETICYNYGDGFVGFSENPHPEYKIWKEMPCGHSGLWLFDRWVCQTCWGYEKLYNQREVING